MEARCLNEDCDRDEWPLRKHPSQYSRGGPQCPDCGTTRVEVEGAETAQQAPTAQPAQQAQQAQPPARQPVQQNQGAVPATQEQMQQAGQMGQAGGAILAALTNGGPEERAQAKGIGANMVAGAIQEWGQQVAQQEMQAAQNAKRVGGQELTPAQDRPICGDCGGQIKMVPPGVDEFECPHCDTLLQAPGGE